jgi:hypothetical protein
MSHRLPVNGIRCLLKLRHASMTAKNSTVNQYSPSRQASQHFSITATLNTGNTQKVGFVRRPISHRMSHRLPVNGDSMPLKLAAPSDAEKKPTANNIPFQRQVSKHFSLNRHAQNSKIHGKSAFVPRPISHRITHPWICGQRRSMPL